MPRFLIFLLSAILFVTAVEPCAHAAQTPSEFGGSVVGQPVQARVLPLSLDQAISMGLRYNLGMVLAGNRVEAAQAARLRALQPLLPEVDATATEGVQQVNLQAEGLRIPGFPAVIGPFGFTDIRAAMRWSLINVSSLRDYLASKHDFKSQTLSREDAKNLVVLTVGNAYMRAIADQALIRSAKARLSTATISLDQANARHNAGTAPLLDVLRAQVDYQTEQQNVITAQDVFEKDKIALARAVGLPLEQRFDLASKIPFQSFETLDVKQAVASAEAHRQDLQALEQQMKAAEERKSAATAERYPTVAFSADYGVIGPTLGHSHGTFDATGKASAPLFDEAQLRGDAQAASAGLRRQQAELNNLRGQIDAEVRENILDIQAAEEEVQVAGSTVDLAREALSEAQQRYAAGVSGNLAVSQAQSSLAQADERYIASLYGDNVARLALARSLGIAQTDLKKYLGGK